MLAAAVLTAGLVPPTRLLVCGGSGFLGREVCREAVARGWAVTSLSRRGANPEPGTTLDQVKWVAGDASDATLLSSLASDADAFVHSVGLLLDTESGLGGLNIITSGSRSKPADGATYDTVMRQTAVTLLEEAAKPFGRPSKRPFVFVSASEAGWPDVPLGRTLEDIAPEWLGRCRRRGVRTCESQRTPHPRLSRSRPTVDRPHCEAHRGDGAH